MYPRHDPDRDPEEPPARRAGRAADLRTLCMIVWGAHLVGLVTGGLGNLVAVVLAYLKRGDAAGTPYADHLGRATTVFWVALVLWVIMGVLAMTVVLGPIAALVWIGLVLYVLITGIKGMLRANERRPYTA